jgi:hypothetical protein
VIAAAAGYIGPVRLRALPIALLLAAAPARGGEDAPGRDPFVAALAGKSGPGAVAAPDFDPEAEAAAWTARPRREIVDALAARLLRGEARWDAPPSGAPPALPDPPSRIPADFEPGRVEVADRLAARVPADAAAVFFGSLDAAETAVGELSAFLPRALPVLCGDPPDGTRDALRRAVEMLLLPTIWRSNPQVRRGIRQVALVVADPDPRWAPDLALVAEVDDASLVLFHRRSTLSWEDRGARRYRADGLDLVADDGSVRSHFALEGGVAVWSTTRSLRERILAAAAGRAASLATPPAAAYALARRTFPAAEGGALLVVPDAFLARANSADLRGRRLAALRCEAARLLLDARSLRKEGAEGGPALSCPSGGTLFPKAAAAGASCSIHGTAEFPAPLGGVTGRCHLAVSPSSDLIATGALPLAARWAPPPNPLPLAPVLEMLLPPGRACARLISGLSPAVQDPAAEDTGARNRRRLNRILEAGVPPERVVDSFVALSGLHAVGGGGGAVWVDRQGAKVVDESPREAMAWAPPQDTERGGVLRISLGEGGGFSSFLYYVVHAAWR